MMLRTAKKTILGTALASTLLLSGCAAFQTQDPYTGETKVNNATKGAGIGAISGAVLGAVIGDTTKGALIGAGVGTLAGAGIGAYMDNQESKLRTELQASGVQVVRNGNNIDLIMPGNITFKTDSSDINSNFYNVLDSVAKVLIEYNKTYINVTGHTDSTGSLQHNMNLSTQRAQSVSQYLASRAVPQNRMRVSGQGPNYPIASNDTAQGKEQNRRVEITLVPVQ